MGSAEADGAPSSDPAISRYEYYEKHAGLPSNRAYYWPPGKNSHVVQDVPQPAHEGRRRWTGVLSVALTLVAIAIGLYTRESVRSMLAISHNSMIALLSVSVGMGVLWFILTRKRPVYLIEFSLFHPAHRLTISSDLFMAKTVLSKFFTEESINFQERILKRTGIGDDTYFPPAVLHTPPQLTVENARGEAEGVLFGCLDDLFVATGLRPHQVDILIVNCSLFSPTPSLSAMIVNHYKMPRHIRTYNLGGMGCSAGIIAIELAHDLLQVYPNSNAVVVSTENISQNWYPGNEKSMLLPNALFRVGGAAILLSNKGKDASRAKYKLLHVVRTHMGADDDAYETIFQCEDNKGNRGVRLSKKLMQIAAESLKANITSLAPLILPLSEKLRYLWPLLQRRLLGWKVASYNPDFKKAIDHICIHAGGRAVIDALEESLQLTPDLVEPSRATLHRWGNTSSSSIWYELGYIEHKGRMHKGQRVWQIAFGSGFKVNSGVWVAMRSNTRAYWGNDPNAENIDPKEEEEEMAKERTKAEGAQNEP